MRKEAADIQQQVVTHESFFTTRQWDSGFAFSGQSAHPTASEAGAVTAERIRTEFRKEIFSPAPGKDVHMKVSIGLAQ
jgi:hypothetical protein